MRNSRAASTSFAASTPAASSRSSERPCESPWGRRWARLSGAARPSWSTTCRRISGSATTTGRRSGRGRSRRSSAWRGSKTGRWLPRSASITTRRACGRRERSSSFARSPSGPGTPSSAPAPKRHYGNRKRGSSSRSKRRQAAPGHGTPARMTPTGMTPSAHDSGSRRKNRHCLRRGSRVCTSKTVRGCVACSKRFCRRRIRGITHTVSCALMEPCDGCRVWDEPIATRLARSRGSLDSNWTSPSAAGPRMRSRRVATRNTIARCERCSRPPRRASCRRTRVGCSSLRIVRSR